MNFIWLKLNLARYQLAILILLTVLQRSPAMRILATLDKALSRPAAQIVKTTTWVATAMGLFHATAGATQFNTAPGSSPFEADVGENFEISFTVTGAPVSPARWEIKGSVAPGLEMVNESSQTLADGEISGAVITVRGQPTAAGIYVFSAQAFNAVGDTDNNEYEVQINVTATIPEVVNHPSSTRVATGGRAQFFFESSGSVDSIQWLKDGSPLSGETSATLILTDVAAGDAGAYSVEISNTSGTVASNAANLTIDDSGEADLVNLSNRGFVGTGGDIMIPGLTVFGGTSKTVLVRGLGPALEAFGVPGFLLDPQLRVFQTIFENGLAVGSQELVGNDDWEVGPGAAELAATLTALGKPLEAGSKDAALLITLNEGVFTFQLSGVGDTTGVGLVELFVVE